MSLLKKLSDIYGGTDCRDLGARQLEILRDGLKTIPSEEITSADDGKNFIILLRKFREAVAENDKLHGDNYPELLKSLLSVGEDGVYSNNLRFIFELIQNVDDCDYINPGDCKLDMKFDFNSDEIILSYNEVGFTPFNVFAITGIAEAAKNVSASKNEIGEKGIGFKSVFGVAEHVLIQSGWFSFELYKDNFTIPVAVYQNDQYYPGTRMTLYVPGRSHEIYRQIRNQYCRKEALFAKNPILFLNKLTSLKLYFDEWRSMEFKVSRMVVPMNGIISREDMVKISVDLRDSDNGIDRKTVEEITCARYTYPVVYSRKACQSRYGENTLVGSNNEGKSMLLQAVVPYSEDVEKVGNGSLYSFLPTQLGFTVPIVCHAPFKLDASREFVDPQDETGMGGNLWFKETTGFLAQLMDYVYSDWAKIEKQGIIYYLPCQDGSLFARNNGKEKCLRSLDAFQGNHYLTLPLFETVNGTYRNASEIFCFNPEEKISEPEKVARMLGCSKELYLAPEDVSKFGITIEKNVYDRLFKRAMLQPELTAEILAYLDTVGYVYSEENFSQGESFELYAEQVECIMKYEKLAKIIENVANEAIRNKQRLMFSLIEVEPAVISEVLYDGFDLSETPKIVERYMNYCKESCVCLDIREDQYLPCRNGIVLSKSKPLSSFAAFCYAMDSKGTFAIRIKLREASDHLNQCIKDNLGSAEDYIRELRNIRKTVRDSLGETGYKSYLDLILKSGTDHTRFIQELLQNADDCVYPEGRIPSFSLFQKGNSILTEYNEAGFNRENIRAITAIGESTKNRLLNGDLRSIGEKGVGFKTVFSVASDVKIHSGEYNFALSADAPTIPKALPAKELVNGTRMEITLKDRSTPPSLKTEDILELCLCLRQLRTIDINGHKLSINDSETQRTITIDRRSHVFSKYIYNFSVTDKEAIEERENGTRKISKEQQIVCYVPEKTTSTEYHLYTGLPTKHKIQIPIVIDAPYELTTSREEIEEDCVAWNNIIRNEMYEAIIKVIHARKETDRANVLRFARFAYRILGNQVRAYVNDLSDSKYLNNYGYLPRLQSERILPTFDKNKFASVNEETAEQYPEAAIFLLKALSPKDYGAINPEEVIDSEAESVSKEQKDRIEAVFNALDCEKVPFTKVFPLIYEHAESFMNDTDFRNCLYEYLQDTPDEFRATLRELKIIPVYGRTGGTQYIAWEDNEIFVKNEAHVSDKSYWVLNETVLSKAICEKMLGVNINEMNAEWERNKYISNLQKIILNEDEATIYNYLMAEFCNEGLQNNDCLVILSGLRDKIPLKNEQGDITYKELFVSDQPDGYFTSVILRKITVHRECAEFAEYIKCRNLSDIYYGDIEYSDQLTEVDIEDLLDTYLKHSEDIIRGLYYDGLVSEELMEEYQLEYLSIGNDSNDENNYSFPEDLVENINQLKLHVKKLCDNPVKIVSKRVEKYVQKGQKADGELFDLNENDARDGALRIYTPEGKKNVCFCQMCQKVKPHRLMEVNNIESKPKLYFTQLRIALCLECSKKFEYMRSNQSKREDFIEAIKKADVSNLGKVDITMGDETITFTAKHLAEIQEILRTKSE